MIRSMIIYGPAGCGKTRNAERLMEHFGLTRIVDREATSIDAYGTLYLMQTPPPLGKRNGARCRSFAQAMESVR